MFLADLFTLLWPHPALIINYDIFDYVQHDVIKAKENPHLFLTMETSRLAAFVTLHSWPVFLNVPNETVAICTLLYKS